jgi:hypothetical protein
MGGDDEALDEGDDDDTDNEHPPELRDPNMQPLPDHKMPTSAQ